MLVYITPTRMRGFKEEGRKERIFFLGMLGGNCDYQY